MLSTLKVIALVALATSATAVPAGGSSSSTVSRWDVKNLYNPGWQFPAEDELRKCVDTAAKQLGADQVKETDPALLKEILEKDMHLDKQEDIAKLLEPLMQKPQPLGDLLNKVRDGMTLHKHHPIVGMVVCAALEHPKASAAFKLPQDAAQKAAQLATIKRGINHMFLLEQIVTKLSMDNAVLVKLIAFMDNTLQEMTNKGHSSWFPFVNRVIEMYKAAGWFGVSKDIAVKMAIDGIASRREINYDKLGVLSSKILLSANILEATLTDGAHDYKPNFKVGVALSSYKLSDAKVLPEGKQLRFGLTDDWGRLYQTWNLAFITGNLYYLNLLYPKLLTPAVSLVDGKTYMYTRVIALWLSVNFYLIAGLQKVPQVKFDGQDALAHLWGDMNLKYKDYLVANNKLTLTEPLR